MCSWRPSMDQVSRIRIKRAPFSAISFTVNFTGIIGNAAVLHIFRRKYDRNSNYRLFVLLLTLFDMGMAIAHIIKEQFRLRRIFNAGVSILCPITNYVGQSIGIGTIFMVLFITVERYKKICTPFKPQFTKRQSSVICPVAILAGAILNIPIPFIFGQRDLIIEDINASRCCILNEFDKTFLPLIHFVILNVIVLAVVVGITSIQFKIRAVLVRQSAVKQKWMNLYQIINSSNATKDNDIQDKQDKHMENDEAFQLNTIASSCSASEFSQARSNTPRSKMHNEERKAAKIAIIFSIISALLIVCFQTLFAYQVVLATLRFFYSEDQISWNRDLFNVYFNDIVTLNGAINPFVYYFTDTKFKQEVKGLIVFSALARPRVHLNSFTPSKIFPS